MKLIPAIPLLFLLIPLNSITQTNQSGDTHLQTYLSDIRAVSSSFSAYFYPNRDKLFALPEKGFVFKVDSLRKTFTGALAKYSKTDKKADPAFLKNQQKEIHYFFDKLILDYPYFHDIVTGEKTRLSYPVQQRMNKNLPDFNNPALLANPDFKEYVRGFLRHQSTIELKKAVYQKMDNQRVNSVLNIIPRYFTNPACRNFWQYDYIFSHLDDWGVKNTGQMVKAFNSSCRDTSYTNKINALYTAGMEQRANHLIKTYKIVNGFDLDIHLFVPDSLLPDDKRPAMVYFSGGSWTKGTPEWAFSGCADLAKKGWVGVSVEYRLADRQNTTPFEAVMDARSAIRWLRKNAREYHIDTNRIIASGNSAGGHLVLATALADKWNESTDDLQYSPVPDLLLVNAGVYDFVGDEGTSWVSQGLNDKNTVREISPVHLVRKGLPPILVIHGTNDRSVPYSSAKLFDSVMKEAGNDFELHTLDGAPHEIWWDRRFSPKVSMLRTEFLKKHGYE